MILLALLNTFLPAVALAAIAWMVLQTLRMNAATRYWGWWAALVAVVTLPFWPIQMEPMPAQIEMTSIAPVEVLPQTSWFVWAVLVYVAFASYRVARIALSYVRLRRIVNSGKWVDATRVDALRMAHGVKRSARLLTTKEVTSPVAAGFLHPVIILPEAMLASLTPEELDHVLLHELAHIVRRDDWTNLAARLAGVFLGLHPVIAFVLSRIEKERELACDDWVVAATGEARPYATSLARVFELSRGELSREHREHLLASGMTGSRLGDRVEQLLTRGRRFTRDASIATLIVMAGVLLGAVAMASRSPALVAFAQEPTALPPVPPAPPVAPTAPTAPVAPISLTAPIAPERPVSPLRPSVAIRSEELQRAQAEIARAELDLRNQIMALQTQREELRRAIEQLHRDYREEVKQVREALEKALRESLERPQEK